VYSLEILATPHSWVLIRDQPGFSPLIIKTCNSLEEAEAEKAKYLATQADYDKIYQEIMELLAQPHEWIEGESVIYSGIPLKSSHERTLAERLGRVKPSIHPEDV
jgi:hypothetical protein